MNSKIGYLKLCIQRGEKNENKWTKCVGYFEHPQANQYTHYGSLRVTGEKGSGRKFEEIMVKNFPDLRTEKDIQIYET